MKYILKVLALVKYKTYYVLNSNLLTAMPKNFYRPKNKFFEGKIYNGIACVFCISQPIRLKRKQNRRKTLPPTPEFI